MPAISPRFGYGLLTLYVSSNQTNLDLSVLFGVSKYQSKIDKKIIINSGVVVGATDTSNYALSIPNGFGGKIYVVNNGSIQGAGGAANGGTGGNVIFAGAPKIYIDNRGTIYSGGGGGGVGGTGGSGYYDCTYTGPCSPSQAYCAEDPINCCLEICCGHQCVQNPADYCPGGYTNESIGQNGCAEGGWRIFCPQTCYTSGGTGGSGGRGQGYDGNFAVGSAGSAGGSNAGTGGTGGTGGDWGMTGSNGGTGSNGNYTSGSSGGSGGLSGYYIVNNGNVTWIATGTRAGRVG